MSVYDPEDTSSPIWAKPGLVTFPFASLGDTATKLVSQVFFVRPEDYAPLTLADEYDSAEIFSSANLSTHPTGVLKFVGDTEPQPEDGGLVSFTRSWAHVPATRKEYSLAAYTFPGFSSVLGSFAGRAAISFPTPTEITYEYVFASGGAGITLSSETRVTDTGTLDAPLLSEVYLNSITNPTRSAYQTLIDSDTDSSSYSITAEMQSVERWKGDIYVKKTVKCKAL